jgi:hypothetical protein
MAFGQHWEWRAFGEVPQALRHRIGALPAWRDEPWDLVDRYLWAPGCPVNVKLREGDLKLKRFVEARDGLECWLEDQDEIYPFPLAAEIVEAVEKALGTRLPHRPGSPQGRAKLLELLAQATPPVRVLDVHKRRRLHELALPGETGAGRPAPVLVELARISHPQAIASVALEHPLAEAVREAHHLLGLGSIPSLHPGNYLQALAVWAQGRQLPAGPRDAR